MQLKKIKIGLMSFLKIFVNRKVNKYSKGNGL